MRVFSMPEHRAMPPDLPQAKPAAASEAPLFAPFGREAFERARIRHTPVFLLISPNAQLPHDETLTEHLLRRTVPVHLYPGERPDAELLCQRAGALFSGEGALPLCALMTSDALPFLAAPLPPAGYPTDPSRLFVWLSHADRRFTLAQQHAQTAQVMQTLSFTPPTAPYAPQDAVRDLTRALLALEDKQHGGFGAIKAPLCCCLRFLQHAGARSGGQAALDRALDAMLASALHDPLDGSFFAATLTDDWRAFVPEKPLGINAMLALILLTDRRQSEAVRLLDFIASAFLRPDGLSASALLAPKDFYAFTPEQVCAALGDEDGLRACRLLHLLRRRAKPEPPLSPSRFSPVAHAQHSALYPTLPQALAPQDAAFLRRALPHLLRKRAQRAQQPMPGVCITQHSALAAAVLSMAGRRLSEDRYTQAAQRMLAPILRKASVLPASVCLPDPARAQPTCGAAAATALALLTLGEQDASCVPSALRLLDATLSAFLDEDGLVLHTPPDARFPRVPAIFDGETPSPAALLVHALRLADRLCPDVRYGEAIEAIWRAAAPAARQQPLACASLIDAMTQQR